MHTLLLMQITDPFPSLLCSSPPFTFLFHLIPLPLFFSLRRLGAAVLILALRWQEKRRTSQVAGLLLEKAEIVMRYVCVMLMVVVVVMMMVWGGGGGGGGSGHDGKGKKRVCMPLFCSLLNFIFIFSRLFSLFSFER